VTVLVVYIKEGLEHSTVRQKPPETRRGNNLFEIIHPQKYSIQGGVCYCCMIKSPTTNKKSYLVRARPLLKTHLENFSNMKFVRREVLSSSHTSIWKPMYDLSTINHRPTLAEAGQRRCMHQRRICLSSQEENNMQDL